MYLGKDKPKDGEERLVKNEDVVVTGPRDAGHRRPRSRGHGRMSRLWQKFLAIVRFERRLNGRRAKWARKRQARKNARQMHHIFI